MLQGRNILPNMQAIDEKSIGKFMRPWLDIAIIVFGMFCSNRLFPALFAVLHTTNLSYWSFCRIYRKQIEANVSKRNT